MNRLLVGTNKADILKNLPDSFLLIDDGPLIDALPPRPRRQISRSPKTSHFDVAKSHFNPLKNIIYRRAKQFISVLDAVFPEGENTLTKKNSNFLLLNALLANPSGLDTLIPKPPARRPDPAHTDAYQKIQTLLRSPVLQSVLCNPKEANFSLDGILLARLNRSELDEDDCFVLANLLIANYKGHVVIPDFGFYGCPFHTSLIRQNRLIAGVNFFDEVPKLRNQLLLINEKIGKHCTPSDAEILAQFAGYGPTVTGHSDFIKRSIE